jgi:hypothetical protein
MAGPSVLFGGGAAKYGSASARRRSGFDRAARRGGRPAGVVPWAGGVVPPHQVVADAVPRSGVERDEPVEARPAGGRCAHGRRRQVGQVRDPADVQQHPDPLGVAEQHVVGERDERRALPARRAVGPAEVAHHGAPRLGRHQ